MKNEKIFKLVFIILFFVFVTSFTGNIVQGCYNSEIQEDFARSKIRLQAAIDKLKNTESRIIKFGENLNKIRKNYTELQITAKNLEKENRRFRQRIKNIVAGNKRIEKRIEGNIKRIEQFEKEIE